VLRLGVSSPQNSPSLSGDEVYDSRDDIGNRKSSENVSSGCMGREKDTVLKDRVKKTRGARTSGTESRPRTSRPAAWDEKRTEY
jgi:hypothetical protein